jgi:hypothetical protein
MKTLIYIILLLSFSFNLYAEADILWLNEERITVAWGKHRNVSAYRLKVEDDKGNLKTYDFDTENREKTLYLDTRKAWTIDLFGLREGNWLHINRNIHLSGKALEESL